MVEGFLSNEHAALTIEDLAFWIGLVPRVDATRFVFLQVLKVLHLEYTGLLMRIQLCLIDSRNVGKFYRNRDFWGHFVFAFLDDLCRFFVPL